MFARQHGTTSTWQHVNTVHVSTSPRQHVNTFARQHVNQTKTASEITETKPTPRQSPRLHQRRQRRPRPTPARHGKQDRDQHKPMYLVLAMALASVWFSLCLVFVLCWSGSDICLFRSRCGCRLALCWSWSWCSGGLAKTLVSSRPGFGFSHCPVLPGLVWVSPLSWLVSSRSKLCSRLGHVLGLPLSWLSSWSRQGLRSFLPCFCS